MYQTHYYSIGVDYHKNFSQVHVLAPDGTAYWKGKITHDHLCEFQSLIERIGAPCRQALEVTMNWHVLYDYLDRTPFLEEIQLANPFKMSIISKTNNKNDKVDAKKIAELLHMGYIPRAHAFSQESMRKAAQGVTLKTYCLLGKPGATEKFNCQDWAEDVRKGYKKLIKEKKIIDECCLSESEKGK